MYMCTVTVCLQVYLSIILYFFKLSNKITYSKDAYYFFDVFSLIFFDYMIFDAIWKDRNLSNVTETIKY